MTQFTANEVRDAITWKYRDKSTRISAMLTAFADMLEAQEKSVPVMVVNHVSSAEHDLPIGMKLYTHPAPADAERLAEALRARIRQLRNIPKGEFQLAASIFADELERIIAAHSVQAQPPAASVPDAMQELADKYHELLWAVARKFPGETRHETALRYIKQTELQSCEPKCDAAMAKESGR